MNNKYKRKIWTREEDTFIFANINKMTIKAIAEVLNCSMSSVYNRVRVKLQLQSDKSDFDVFALISLEKQMRIKMFNKSFNDKFFKLLNGGVKHDRDTLQISNRARIRSKINRYY